jgi:UDP-glucose 4-epimerase
MTDSSDTATDFRDSRVLITGGLGFIGSALARRLVHAGAQVTLVDSLVPEYGGNFANISDFESDVRVNVSDVRDTYSLGHLVRGCDYLFNLAGQTSHMDSMQDPQTDLEINCRAQLSILEVCRQQNPDIKIVFASTRQIYGKPDYLPIDEKHLVRPVDVNGINKAAGEAYHILYNNVYGIQATALRLTNTYGPGMRVKDARQTFLGIWVRNIVQGAPFEVWGGDQLRDFTYVEDAVDAFLLSASTPGSSGRVMNLGGDVVISLADLGRLLVEVAGEGVFLVKEFPADRKVIDIGDYYADDSLARNILGWQPRVPLRQGLERTVTYYRGKLEQYL